MSPVTNAILTAHVGLHTDSDPEIDSVNKFLRENDGGGGGEFVEVSHLAGGVKHMECRIYVSAFNHTNLTTILGAVDQAPWIDKETVQVFVKEQGDDLFKIRYSGGRITS
jgi:hypothetical protein